MRRPGTMASKAPLTSRVRIEATLPSAQNSSISWTAAVTKSIADLSGRAPNCWLCRICALTASQAMRLAMILSSPFPSVARRAMGR